MAERRMFAKTIVLSDAFLDMPLSTRCLYFTLGMLADDDGFINSPKSVMRQCGSSIDDLNLLIAKKFLIPFDSGVVVIKHWRINNYLRNDRYQETKYIEEKNRLLIDENGSYKSGIPGIPPGIPNSGIPSIGKDRLGKDRLNTTTTTTCACAREDGEFSTEDENKNVENRTPNVGEVYLYFKSNMPDETKALKESMAFHAFNESHNWDKLSETTWNKLADLWIARTI